MKLTPEAVERMAFLENDLIAQRLSFAHESDRARDRRLAKRSLLAQMEASTHPGSQLLPTIQALSPIERRSYSLGALLASSMKPGKPELTLEREVSMAISKDVGQQPTHGGHWIPLKIHATGLDSKTGVEGGYLAQTKVGNIVDSLRAQARILQLGGQLMTGLRYSTQFPVEATVMAASWTDENSGADVSESNTTFGAKTVAPHSLAATTSFSKQLLSQSSADLEQWIRDRIGKSHALALDAVAIAGSGTSSQPLGLLKTVGIGDVSIGVSGGAPTLDKLLDLEDVVGAANASDNCAFLTSSRMRKKMRKLLEITGGGEPVWSEDGVLGYAAAISAQCPTNLVKGSNSDCHPIIFGDFSTLLLVEFEGALEVVVDPFTAKKKGNVEICSWGTYDFLASQPPAMAAIQDCRDI